MKCWNVLLSGLAVAFVTYRRIVIEPGAFALALATPAQAQWDQGGGQRERPSAEAMAKRRQESRSKLFAALKLDAAQAKLVDALLTVRDDRRMDMMEEMRASMGDRQAMQDMRKQMEALQKETDEKINAALSQEQRKVYAALLQKEAKERADRRGGQRRGGEGAGGEGAGGTGAEGGSPTGSGGSGGD